MKSGSEGREKTRRQEKSGEESPAREWRRGGEGVVSGRGTFPDGGRSSAEVIIGRKLFMCSSGGK